MREILTVYLMLCGCLLVQATSQIPDRVEYNGTDFNLGRSPFFDSETYPLEKYFEQNDTLKKNVFWEYRGAVSSNCWRGYVAQWQIKDDKLFLLDFSFYPSVKEDKKGDLFAQKKQPKNILSLLNKDWKSPVFAEWFNGEMILSDTKKWEVYLLTIKEGIVTEIIPLEEALKFARAIPKMDDAFFRIWWGNMMNRSKDRADRPFFLVSYFKMYRFCYAALHDLKKGVSSSKVKTIFKEIFGEIPMTEMVNDTGHRVIKYYFLKQDENEEDIRDISIDFIFKLSGDGEEAEDAFEEMIVDIKITGAR